MFTYVTEKSVAVDVSVAVIATMGVHNAEGGRLR